MKFSVNSTVSILSDSNSTLELFNGTNATVSVEVSNTSILSQITTLDKTFPTNATRTVPRKMSTTESVSLNENVTKPTVLSHNMTSSKLREPTTTKLSSTNIFQETTGQMKKTTLETTKEILKNTSEFPKSLQTNFYGKSLSWEKVSENTKKSTISTLAGLTKPQNSNVIFSTEPFTVKKTTEFKKKPQSTRKATTTTKTTTTARTTTRTTTTAAAPTTTVTKITTPPLLQSTTNKIKNIETSFKIKKTTDRNKITKPTSTEISNPSTIETKELIEKATTKRLINNKTAHKIENKSTKTPTKHYRKSPEISTSKSTHSRKSNRITTEKLENITHRGKVKHSTLVSTNRRYGKPISKTTFQRLLKNDTKPTLTSKTPNVVYGGYKFPTTSHFINSQFSIDDANMDPTTAPNITMGAGPLVIVVLLPFLALFLIAVVTALRRKMKKSRRRIIRVQSRDLDNLSERNQSQMIPLTKPEANQ